MLTIAKKGIYRSGTSTMNAYQPYVSQITVQMPEAVATTKTKIYFPDAVDVKGGMVVRSGARNGPDQTQYSNANKSVGFFDSTGEICFQTMTDPENAPQPQEANRSHSSITVARRVFNAPYNGDPEEAWTVSSMGVGWIELECTVDTTGANTESSWSTIVVWGGTEVTSAETFTQDDMGTSASAVTVTTTAVPTLVLLGTIHQSEAVADYDDVTLTARADNIWSMGFAINDTGTPQGCFSLGTPDYAVQTPPVTTIALHNTACLARSWAGAIDYDITAGGFTSSPTPRFTLTPSASTSNAIVFGLCLTFSDQIDLDAFDSDYPTSSTYAKAGLGYTPDFFMNMGMVGVTTYDTATQATHCGEHLLLASNYETMSHSMGHSHGVDSWQAASQISINTYMSAWQSNADPTVNTEIYVAPAITFTDGGWSETPTTYPGTAIKTRGFTTGIPGT